MTNDTNKPSSESDLEKREKQQGLKKPTKSRQVEERPADRTNGEEEGKKHGSPTPPRMRRP